MFVHFHKFNHVTLPIVASKSKGLLRNMQFYMKTTGRKTQIEIMRQIVKANRHTSQNLLL